MAVLLTALAEQIESGNWSVASAGLITSYVLMD